MFWHGNPGNGEVGESCGGSKREEEEETRGSPEILKAKKKKKKIKLTRAGEKAKRRR